MSFGLTAMALPLETSERLLVALLVGFLIGLDRERAEARKRQRLFAGIRTFPLIALAGAVPMLLIDIAGAALVVASFVAVAAIALVSYLRGSAAGDIGATTEMAALATFLLGALAGAGQLLVAGAAGVVVAVLLVAKPRLEAFSRALTAEELAATLELAVISVIVLPLLPHRGYGPWQVLNPFEIWLVVVIVAALSFAGFIAERAWGERRGLAIAALFGALVSSTAVTVAMAGRSRRREDQAGSIASAAVLASAATCVRVAVLIGSFGLGMLPRVLPVAGVMALEGLLAAWWLGRQAGGGESGPSGADVQNPFSLTVAGSFAVIYTLVLLVVEAARQYQGAPGLYAAAALSALADVDAVSIACARLGSADGLWRTPAAAVTIAVVTNTLTKLVIALVAGRGRFRVYAVTALGAMATLGAATGAFVFLRF